MRARTAPSENMREERATPSRSGPKGNLLSPIGLSPINIVRCSPYHLTYPCRSNRRAAVDVLIDIPSSVSLSLGLPCAADDQASRRI